MLNLHVYRPGDLTARDWRELEGIGFDVTTRQQVTCVVFVTQLSESGVMWDGGFPINPAWRCVHKGHWFIYYRS